MCEKLLTAEEAPSLQRGNTVGGNQSSMQLYVIMTIYGLSFEANKVRGRQAEDNLFAKETEAICSFMAEALFKKPTERSRAIKSKRGHNEH